MHGTGRSDRFLGLPIRVGGVYTPVSSASFSALSHRPSQYRQRSQQRTPRPRPLAMPAHLSLPHPPPPIDAGSLGGPFIAFDQMNGTVTTNIAIPSPNTMIPPIPTFTQNVDPGTFQFPIIIPYSKFVATECTPPGTGLSDVNVHNTHLR